MNNPKDAIVAEYKRRWDADMAAERAERHASWIFGIIVVVWIVLAIRFATAAPALPRGGDVVTGTLDLGGPWVRVTLPGNGGSKDYWLVFTSEEAENAATDIGTGEEVTVTGRIAYGGQWRYLIVNTVRKIE